MSRRPHFFNFVPLSPYPHPLILASLSQMSFFNYKDWRKRQPGIHYKEKESYFVLIIYDVTIRFVSNCKRAMVLVSQLSVYVGHVYLVVVPEWTTYMEVRQWWHEYITSLKLRLRGEIFNTTHEHQCECNIIFTC